MSTPCVKICVMDGNRCIGCNRTKKQIAEWNTYSKEQQDELIKELENEQHKIEQRTS